MTRFGNQYGLRLPRGGSSAAGWDRIRAIHAKLRASRGSQAMHQAELDRPTVDPVVDRRRRRKARRQFTRWKAAHA